MDFIGIIYLIIANRVKKNDATFGKLARAMLETLLEKISCPLQLGPSIPLEELCQVGVPDVVNIRPLEQRDALLIGTERLLVVLVLFEEHAIVDDDLGRCDFQIQDSVVNRLARLEGAKALLQVGKHGPNLKRLVQPVLYGFRVIVVSDFSRRWHRGSVHQFQGSVVVVVLQFHLGPRTPHRGQVVHFQVCYQNALLKYNSRILELSIGVVELGKCNPQRVEFANCLLRVNSLHGLCVSVDDLKYCLNI